MKTWKELNEDVKTKEHTVSIRKPADQDHDSFVKDVLTHAHGGKNDIGALERYGKGQAKLRHTKTSSGIAIHVSGPNRQLITSVLQKKYEPSNTKLAMNSAKRIRGEE